MSAESEKPQERKVEIKTEKSGESLAKSMPAVDANSLRSALMANLQRHWTIPPEGKDEAKPRESFQLIDNGRVIASKDNSEAIVFRLKPQDDKSKREQEQAYKAAGYGDVGEPIGKPFNKVESLPPNFLGNGSLYPDGPPPIPKADKPDEDVLAQAQYWRIQPSQAEKGRAGNTAVGELHGIVNTGIQAIISVGDIARMSVAAGPIGKLAPDLDPEGRKMLGDACGGMSNFSRIMVQFNTTLNPASVFYRQDFDPDGRQMAEKLLAKMPEHLKKELEQYKHDDDETKARKITELSLNIGALALGTGELNSFGTATKSAEGLAGLSKAQEISETSLAKKMQDDLRSFADKLKDIHSEKLDELSHFVHENFNMGGPRFAYDGPAMNANRVREEAKDYVSQMAKPKDSDGFKHSEKSREQGESREKSGETNNGLDITRLAEHPLVRDVLSKAAENNMISPEDGKRVSDLIANSLRDQVPDIDKRNIAFGVYTETSGKQRLIIATSKDMDLEGLAPLVKEPTFKIIPAGAQDVRLDSEYKILELLNKELPKTAAGKLALYTEQIPCRSCGPVIDQFMERFPNIKKTFQGPSYSYEDALERKNANALRTNR